MRCVYISTYIRIVDNYKNTLVGYKDYCYWGQVSIKESHIKTASAYTKDKVEYKCNYLIKQIGYPVYVQVIKKIKYKNGNITKNVIFEKIIT